MEAVDLQTRSMETKPAGEVNRVSVCRRNDRGRKPDKAKGKGCYRCGRDGHLAKDPSCPARDATCNKCKMIGHFAAVCRTKQNLNRVGVAETTDRTSQAVVCGDREAEADFLVIRGQGRSLLSKSMAEKLGVLKVGWNVNTVQGEKLTLEDIQKRYPQVFNGTGKLKNYQAKIHIYRFKRHTCSTESTENSIHDA